MPVNPLSISIRARKLGALIRNARHELGKTIEECAQALGVSKEDFEMYELGEKAPSLPETEYLAYYLNLPLEYFLGRQKFSTLDTRSQLKNLDQLMSLRNRVIGAKIRQSRQDRSISLEDLSQQVDIDEGRLEDYELGYVPIPLPELETITSLLDRSPADFIAEHGPVGDWRKKQVALKNIEQLPPELQEFISKPINRPYLELAQRLSEMSVDKLRAVAEGLLEITL